MRDAVALIIVGNEILSGKVRDTNSPYLIGALRELGTTVGRLDVLPDDVETIAVCVRERSRDYRAVLTVGGVGPTLDDVTVEAIAVGLERPLVVAPRLEEVLRQAYGEELRPAHRKMALVPRGARLLETPGVLWPQVAVDNVYVFPGTPELLARKFGGVAERFRGAPFHVRRLFTTLEEADLAELLDRVAASHPGVTVGSYPVYEPTLDHRVQLVLESKDPVETERALAQLTGGLDPSVIVRVDRGPESSSISPRG